MSIPADRLVLLDTTVVVHLVRNDPTGQELERKLSLAGRMDRPLISTVTQGELLGLAKYWKWGKDKLEVLDRIVGELVPVEAGHREVIETYAELYAEGHSNGRPCGENDLWIAATAKATKAVLITCDRDFDWLHPSHITRFYVPEVKKDKN